MTAAELHATALARIAELRAVNEAGTDRPWAYDGNPSGWVKGGDGLGVHEQAWRGTPQVPALPDAALIVAAVNAFDPLLTLAEEVLGRHAPIESYWFDGAACDSCTDTEGESETSWPCPDAAAALRALGVE